MDTGNLMRELELFRLKIAYYFGQLASFIRRVIDDPSVVSRSDLVVLCAAALIVALFLAAGLIRFITEPWKKKAESLLVLLLVLLIAAAAAFFVLRGVPLP